MSGKIVNFPAEIGNILFAHVTSATSVFDLKKKMVTVDNSVADFVVTAKKEVTVSSKFPQSLPEQMN